MRSVNRTERQIVASCDTHAGLGYGYLEISSRDWILRSRSNLEIEAEFEDRYFATRDRCMAPA